MKKLAICAVVLFFLALILIPQPVIGNKISSPIQSNNVELVKKVTVKGKPQGGKPSKVSATGILGELCTGEKYAIVIGISDYPGTANDLEYADDDARVMKDALTKVYGFSESNIRLLIDSDATYNNIVSAIGEIGTYADQDSEVFFFFSGHGAKGTAADDDSERIDESIVCHDETNTNLVFLWDGELKALFKDYTTSRIIFVFDSCVSGGMTDLAQEGRVIAMATTESGTAYEFSSLGQGQFTYYFVVEGIQQGKADTYDNITDRSDVTVEEAFDYAKANCAYQRPTIADLFVNDLLP